MTNSEIFKAAHAEAKRIMGLKRLCFDRTYAKAFKFALRRVYNKIEQDRFVASVLAKPETPKFMWLRGM